MVIDSHLHLWVNRPEKYPWSPIGGYIPDGEAPLERFLGVMAENAIDGAVLVQPTPYGWDNTYLLECKQADQEKFRAVVLVDPLSEGAVDSLKRLIGEGANGLRINLHLQPLAAWDDIRFYELWEGCRNLDLPVCLQLTPEYLPFVGDIASTYHIPIIIDHLGRPQVGSKLDDAGFLALLRLAEKPNIFVKLSGMNYYSAELAPYRDTWQLLAAAKERFGAERCLWGSDFPFVDEHWSYPENLNTIRKDFGFEETELEWILSKTARSIWWKG